MWNLDYSDLFGQSSTLVFAMFASEYFYSGNALLCVGNIVANQHRQIVVL